MPSFSLSDTVAHMSDRQTDLLSVRVPAEMREALERVAKKEHRTVSDQVRFIISRAVTQQQHEGAAA